MPYFQTMPPFRTASQEDERYGGVLAVLFCVTEFWEILSITLAVCLE